MGRAGLKEEAKLRDSQLPHTHLAPGASKGFNLNLRRSKGHAYPTPGVSLAARGSNAPQLALKDERGAEV